MKITIVVFTCKGQVKNYFEFLLLFLLGEVQKETLGFIWEQNFINRKLDDLKSNGGPLYKLFHISAARGRQTQKTLSGFRFSAFWGIGRPNFENFTSHKMFRKVTNGGPDVIRTALEATVFFLEAF